MVVTFFHYIARERFTYWRTRVHNHSHNSTPPLSILSHSIPAHCVATLNVISNGRPRLLLRRSSIGSSCNCPLGERLTSHLNEETDNVVVAYRNYSLFSSSCMVSPVYSILSIIANLIMCASSLLAIYVIIYATCIWVLIRRKRQGYMWHLVSSTILFLLASVQVALLVVTLVQVMNYENTVYDGDDLEQTAQAEARNSMLIMQTAFNTTILLSL
jgi:lysylphosphatidylglycerol synthetase-like protein (DUF2156 family)